MADCKLLAPKIFAWEGGFVNDPVDRGGATNKGVTIATWKQVGYDNDGDGDIDVDDIRLLTEKDATIVLKRFYWDRWLGDQIANQSTADILVDWLWSSGKWGIVIPQRILQLPDDGIVGAKTIRQLNAVNQEVFHSDIKRARGRFILEIVRDHPEQNRFLNGWMNRLNSFTFST